jgi:DNA-directed RNA polymerase subunit RPC12/RpoP
MKNIFCPKCGQDAFHRLPSGTYLCLNCSRIFNSEQLSTKESNTDHTIIYVKDLKNS